MKPKGSNEKWIVCRVCLQQPSTGLESIFHQNDDQDLTHMILECGGVPIKKFDHYPDKICTKCLKYLKVAYKFRTTCQRSHKHLSRFIAPVEAESEEQQLIAVVDEDGVEELQLKVEPKEVKEEIDENEMVLDMFDVFEEEEEESQFIQEDKTEEAEYLDELENELLGNTSEDECSSESKKAATIKAQVKKEKKSESFSQRISTIKKEKSIRGPKIRIPKQKETSCICDVCGNIYPTQGRLNEHIKIHRGIKPYDCEICGHAFAQTQQLTRHMNTHTGQRPYKCSYCPAAFADLSTRNKHHRIHTNERPYVCDVCGKAFTYTNTLKVHKMIHTGEKPHVCDICGKSFNQAYKLRNHKETHLRKLVRDEKDKLLVQAVESDEEDSTPTVHVLEM